MAAPDGPLNSILIVEDEPAIVKMCQRALVALGLDIDVAANGKLAQEMIARKHYDLLLVDIKMPVLDGRELYQWLSARHPALTGKVIFTSGDVISGDTKDFLEGTGLSFLAKPFAAGELQALVKIALAGA